MGVLLVGAFSRTQLRLDKHEPGMIVDEITTRTTLLLKRSLMNETINAEVLCLHDLDIEDGMVRPKLSYELNDEVIISVTIDAFYGDSKGVFGQFNKTDRLVIGAVVGF